MKKRMRLWAAGALLALLLGACSAQGAAEGSSGGRAGTEPPASAPEASAPAPKASSAAGQDKAAAPAALPENVRWAVEPTLELELLTPVALMRGTTEEYYNTCGLVSPDGLSVAQRDGKLGLLNHNGEWVLPCEYCYITCGYEQQYLFLRRGQTEGAGETMFTWDENGRLREIAPGETYPDGGSIEIGITGTSVNPVPCWVADEGKLYTLSDATIGDFYGDAPDYPVRALRLESNTSDAMQALASTPEYLLTDGTKPVSWERYQDMGCVAEGIVPAKKDGKWGYLDVNGAVVIPFEYDESWPRTEVNYWMAQPCFNATESTVVLCKNGAYALYTVSGGEVIPFGACEQLLPVYEGRLWAKQDGKWGVLELLA